MPFGTELEMSKGGDPVAAVTNFAEFMLGGLLKGDVEHFNTFVNINSKEDEAKLMKFLEYAAEAAAR